MGTTTAKSIIDRAAYQLKDTPAKRWSRTEMLGWINDAQRAVVQAKPSANNVLAVVSLVSGTKQSLPSTGWLLLDVIRNMNSDGTTPNKVVRPVAREFLDRFDPDWHTKSATAVVDNFTYDTTNQTTFYVYPPNTGTGKLELNYSAVPADLTTESQTISLLDIYQPHLLAYVLAQACLKDADYSAAMKDMAVAYTNLFTQLVASTSGAENANNAMVTLLPQIVRPTGQPTQ